MKVVVFLFCLFSLGLASAENCMKEGEFISLHPSYNRPCCEGLEAMAPPAGVYGSGGQCLRKVNGQFCFGEGSFTQGLGNVNCCPGLLKRVTNFNQGQFVCEKGPSCVTEGNYLVLGPANPGCCEGLTPVVEDPRRMGGAKCVRPATCVGENQYIHIGPNQPSKCCEGLALLPPPRGMIGSGGQCVKNACVSENNPLMVYPGAPACCAGLSPGSAPRQFPFGFAQVCVRNQDGSQVNDSEGKKDVPSYTPSIHLTDDPGGVSRQ